MSEIRDLVRSAVEAGARFERSGQRVVVRGVSLIPEDIRNALKERRDELYHELQPHADDGTSVGLLKSLGIDAMHINDDATARRMIKGIICKLKGAPAAIDFETTASRPSLGRGSAFSPLYTDVRLVQIYAGGSVCLVLDMDGVHWSSLDPLWSETLIFHNAQFELSFLRRRNIAPPRFECTMQAAGLLLGVGSRSLAIAAKVYFGWDMDKTFQTADWGRAILPAAYIDYAALDAVAAYRLWQRFEDELHIKQRWEAYKIQRNAVPAAVEMLLSGIGINTAAHSEFVDRWHTDLSKARRLWSDSTGNDVPSKRNDLEEFLRTTLTPDEVASWPRTKKTDQLSTSADVLEKAIHIPGISQLLHIRHLEKLINTFGDRLMDWVNPQTGRLHPHYNVAATKSGRWTCSKPNLQQIPSDRLSRGFREIFTAPADRVLIGADYSQMELRVAAEISGDPELRRVYADGQDLHRMMAAEMADISESCVTAEQRSRAKPVNFGAIYGMGADGLVKAAWSGYRVEMSPDEARKYLSSFFQKFRVLKRWMHEHSQLCVRRRQINIASGRVLEAGWETSGDIRYTQSCNLPVQGASADVMMQAIAGVQRCLRQTVPGAVLVAQIHDELIVEAAASDARCVSEILLAEMSRVFSMNFPDAPITDLVNVTSAASWGGLK